MTTPFYMHPMSIGDVLDTAFNFYRSRFRTLFAITAVVQAPILVLTLVSSYFGAGIAAPDFGADPAAFGMLFAFMGVGLCAAFIGVVGTIVQTSALIYATSEQFHERPTTAGRAYREALRHGASLAICTLLLGGAVFVLAACWFCVLPLVLLVPLAVRWMFAYQAIVLEDADGVSGLRSSWHLVRGQFWRTLGFGLVLMVMSSVASLGPTYLVSFLGFAITDQRSAYVLSTAAGNVIGMVLSPVYAGAMTLYYYDLRMRQEGYDLTLQAAQLESAAA